MQNQAVIDTFEKLAELEKGTVIRFRLKFRGKWIYAKYRGKKGKDWIEFHKEVSPNGTHCRLTLGPETLKLQTIEVVSEQEVQGRRFSYEPNSI